MTSTGSVELGERPRLFCALRLPEHVVDALVDWQGAHIAGGRVVPRGNLHVTLAFLGAQPRDRVETIVAELREAAAELDEISFEVTGYREGRAVGMLVCSDEGGAATRLAEDVQRRLERRRFYRPEARAWLPHITVVRFRERLRLRPPLPQLQPFSPSDAAVYLSRLRPGGAEYVVLESMELGGR
jgi:2'-5' RNA ligase